MTVISQQLDQTCGEFVDVIRSFVSQKILLNEILQDYTKSRSALHGILESAFVVAGWRMNLFPVVEPRVPLSTPLDPGECCAKLEGKRKRHQFRPDVGFCRDGMLDTFVECCTIDEAKEYESSVVRAHVTKRDTLLHFARYAQPKVSAIIICVALPSNVIRAPPWRWAREMRARGSDYFAYFGPGWNKLAQDLQQVVPTRLVIMNENGIYVNNGRHDY